MRFVRVSALILLATSVARAQTVDGWKLTVRTTIDSGSVDHKHWITSTMRIAGHFVRTELTDARISRPMPGNEIPATIYDDSAHTSTFVYGKLHSASVTQRAATSQIAMPNDSTSRFIVAPKITTRDLGAGEPILGHPTHKYSYAISFVAQTTFLGAPCKRTANSVETIWAATDIPRDELLRKYVRDSRPQTGVELGPVADSVERLRLHRERLISGLILRSEIALTKVDAHGAKKTVTNTMEVTELSHGPLPQSLFMVPAGYTTAPPPRRITGTAVDSAPIKLRRAKMESVLTARTHAAICDP